MSYKSKRFSAKTPFEGRTSIQMLDAGLTSVRGAQDIISMMSTRHTVTKLIIGHNNLGNEGTNVLFRYLESPLGRKYPIVEISLNSNGIKNEGLLAISRYIKDNQILQELFLQANALAGDPTVTQVFVDALNSSKIEILSLAANHGLGDTFIEHFLPALRAPHLRELHISTIGLTPRSVPYITHFIRAPGRCRLHTFACNGNSLGLRGVRSIIAGIEQSNYSLLFMEFYANQRALDDIEAQEDALNIEEEEEADENSFEVWKAVQDHLTRLRSRNDHLRRETQSQALDLLRYSRVLLLHSSLNCDTRSLTTSSRRSGSPSPTMTKPDRTTFPFVLLPTELQLSILSLLAPSLSSSQRSRIFSYAAANNTLPPLLPTLRRLNSFVNRVPRSNSVATFPSGNAIDPLLTVNGGADGRTRSDGLMNTASLNRDKERNRWLDIMGCSFYDPE